MRTGESLTISGVLQIVMAQQQQINTMLYTPQDKMKGRDNYFG